MFRTGRWAEFTGRSREAEELIPEALAALEATAGKKNLYTTRIATSWGETLTGGKRIIEAEAMFVQALDARRHILGAKHPDTIDSMSKVIIALVELGKHDAADQLSAEVLTLREVTFGVDDVWRGDEKFHHRALGGHKKNNGSGDGSTILTLHDLVLTLTKSGKAKEAEDWYGAGLKMLRTSTTRVCQSAITAMVPS